MATLTKGKTFTNGELVTPATIHQLVDAATISGIVNADISATAAIADTKLATISTANKVSQSAVTNLTTDLAGKAASSHTHDDRYYTESEIDTKLSGLPLSGHTHTIANVTGLQTALDGKQASGSYAPATGIAQSAVTNLTADLAGKAASSHTHTIANVTGLQTALDGKAASGSYAAVTHTHAISDTTGLQTALDGKAASNLFSGDGIANTKSGAQTLASNISGGSNTATGAYALQSNTTGSSNTAIGVLALNINQYGDFNTACGSRALYSNAGYSNASGLGYNAQVTGSDKVQIGGPNTTTYVYGAVQDRSDLRDKTDIRNTELGLDFINALRPVDYKWDLREDYRAENAEHVALGNITHDGSK
jgi:hypothetical protein